MTMIHPCDRVGRRSKTEVEALVLDCLQKADGPLGAYEIIEHVASVGSRLIPAQAYRTLGRLVDDHLVYR